MRVVHLSAALLLLSHPVFATEVDWQAAEGGIFYQGRAAYAGCAMLNLPAEMAKKIATVRAAANNARAHSLVVSGEEHARINGEASEFEFTITESASAILKSVTVLHEEVLALEGDKSICVLISAN